MGIQTINLSDEASRLARPLIEKKEFSEWVNNKIIKELKDEETLQLEKKKYLDKVAHIDSQIKVLKELELQVEDQKKKEQEEELSGYELEWWKETIKVLSDNPTFFDGRKNLYNNEFNKQLGKVDFAQLYNSIRIRLEKKEVKE